MSLTWSGHVNSLSLGALGALTTWQNYRHGKDRVSTILSDIVHLSLRACVKHARRNQKKKQRVRTQDPLSVHSDVRQYGASAKFTMSLQSHSLQDVPSRHFPPCSIVLIDCPVEGKDRNMQMPSLLPYELARNTTSLQAVLLLPWSRSNGEEEMWLRAALRRRSEGINIFGWLVVAVKP